MLLVSSVAFSAMLEAGVESAALAVENCKERIMLEKDELEEVLPQSPQP